MPRKRRILIELSPSDTVGIFLFADWTEGTAPCGPWAGGPELHKQAGKEGREASRAAALLHSLCSSSCLQVPALVPLDCTLQPAGSYNEPFLSSGKALLCKPSKPGSFPGTCELVEGEDSHPKLSSAPAELLLSCFLFFHEGINLYSMHLNELKIWKEQWLQLTEVWWGVKGHKTAWR